MDWTTGLAIGGAVALGPLFAKLLAADKRREEREIAEWEAEQEAKKKAKDEYALAILQPPPLLGHDDSGSCGTDGERARSSDPSQ